MSNLPKHILTRLFIKFVQLILKLIRNRITNVQDAPEEEGEGKVLPDSEIC